MWPPWGSSSVLHLCSCFIQLGRSFVVRLKALGPVTQLKISEPETRVSMSGRRQSQSSVAG